MLYPLSSYPTDPVFWLALSYPQAAPAAVYLRPHSTPMICRPPLAMSLLFLICRCSISLFGHNFPKGEQKWFSIAPCMTNGGNMLKSSQKCPWEDKWIFSRIINLINKFACIFIRAIEVFPAQLDERCCVITSSFTFCHPLPFVWITEKRQSVCVCVCVCMYMVLGLHYMCTHFLLSSNMSYRMLDELIWHTVLLDALPSIGPSCLPLNTH